MAYNKSLNRTPGCYSLLFKVAWSALRDLCSNPRFLGAQTGAVALLHTWSSTMTYHPHVHMLVPAGGLSEDAIEWIKAKDDFLVPVKVLSKIYRARFCDKLKSMITNNVLVLPEETDVNALQQNLYKKQWVVYAKKTGKYIREMTLPADEFIRRFIQHILPLGFYKIRYFGILATANIKDKKEQCLALIGKQQPLSELEGLNDYEAFRLITGRDPSLCKKCKTGSMAPVILANTG